MWLLMVAAGTGYLVGCWKKTVDFNPLVCGQGRLRNILSRESNLQRESISSAPRGCRQIYDINSRMHMKATGEADLDSASPTCYIPFEIRKSRKSGKNTDLVPNLGTNSSHGLVKTSCGLTKISENSPQINLSISAEASDSITYMENKLKRNISDMGNIKLSHFNLLESGKKKTKSLSVSNSSSESGNTCTSTPKSIIEVDTYTEKHVEGYCNTYQKVMGLFGGEEYLQITGDNKYNCKSFTPLYSPQSSREVHNDCKRSVHNDSNGLYWNENENIEESDVSSDEDTIEESLHNDGQSNMKEEDGRIALVKPTDALFRGFLENTGDVFEKYHLGCLHDEGNRKRRYRSRRKPNLRKFPKGGGALRKNMFLWENSKRWIKFPTTNIGEEEVDSVAPCSSLLKPLVDYGQRFAKNEINSKILSSNVTHPILSLFLMRNFITQGAKHTFLLSNDGCDSEISHDSNHFEYNHIGGREREILIQDMVFSLSSMERRVLGSMDNTKNPVEFHHEREGESLFNFGIGVGVMFMLAVSRIEFEKVRNSLKEAGDLITSLREGKNIRESVEGRAFPSLMQPEKNNVEEESSSSSDGLSRISREIDFTHTSLYRHFDMDELEAQLEAELDLMELIHHEKSGKIQAEQSGFVETDPDIVLDMVHGEQDLSMQSNSGMVDLDLCSIDEQNYGNYSYHISPKELKDELDDIDQTSEESVLDFNQCLQMDPNNVEDCMPLGEQSCDSQSSGDELEEDDMHAEYDENFAVLPTLLERRLWEVLHQRQEDSILELQEAVKLSEEKLRRKEKELWRWKDGIWWCHISIFFIVSFVVG